MLDYVCKTIDEDYLISLIVWFWLKLNPTEFAYGREKKDLLFLQNKYATSGGTQGSRMKIEQKMGRVLFL